MPARATEILYLATNGFVIAISTADGTELWRVRPPNGANACPLTLLLKNDRLYVAGKGRVWCLNRKDGTVLWENGLPRTGFGAVLMALEGATGGSDDGAAAAAVIRRQQEQAAANSA